MNDREMTSDQIKRLLNRSATYHGKSYTISGIGTSILGVSLMLQAEGETQYVPLEQVTVDGFDQGVKEA